MSFGSAQPGAAFLNQLLDKGATNLGQGILGGYKERAQGNESQDRRDVKKDRWVNSRVQSLFQHRRSDCVFVVKFNCRRVKNLIPVDTTFCLTVPLSEEENPSATLYIPLRERR